jgi:hypothetical protein
MTCLASFFMLEDVMSDHPVFCVLLLLQVRSWGQGQVLTVLCEGLKLSAFSVMDPGSEEGKG